MKALEVATERSPELIVVGAGDGRPDDSFGVSARCVLVFRDGRSVNPVNQRIVAILVEDPLEVHECVRNEMSDHDGCR